MSEEDIEELKLLSIQEISIGILLYSDLFFYLNVNQNIKILLEKNSESREIEIEKIIESLYSFYNFGVIGLVGVTSILVVDFTRYKNLNIKNNKDNICENNIYLLPELYIAMGAFFQVICYRYFVISAIEFYKRALENFYYIYNSNTEILLNICIYMKIASIIRITADCYFYNATLMSINKIFSRYEKKDKKRNIGDSDLTLFQGSILFLAARIMIYKANIVILNEVYRDTESENKEIYLLPNKIVVLANIYGVIGNSLGVYGIGNLYMRNKNQVVIGI